MNIKHVLSQRRLGFPAKYDLDFVIDQIKLVAAHKVRNDLLDDDAPNDLCRRPGGPLCITNVTQEVLALGCEDGSIILIDNQKLNKIKHFNIVQNAIFDLSRQPDKNCLAMAAGDASIKLWDLEADKNLLEFSPHNSSIKSVSFYDTNTLCSGSRDGTVQVHDLRLEKPNILVINDAHRNESYSKKRVRRPRNTRTDPVSCVTCTIFDPYVPRIYSTGANDASIKLWDLRKMKRKRCNSTVTFEPYHTIHHPTKGLNCGYSQLKFSNCKLYAGCSDNKIYCYNNLTTNEKPLVFIGFDYEPYFKLDILDDKLLIAGSGFGGTLIWSLGNRSSSVYYPDLIRQPYGRLKVDTCGTGDTSVVATHPPTYSILTFRDDYLAFKWMIDRSNKDQRNDKINNQCPNVPNSDVSIELSDILDVNVPRRINA